jgi:hypothetical protein
MMCLNNVSHNGMEIFLVNSEIYWGKERAFRNLISEVT